MGTLYHPSYDLPTIKAIDLAVEQANETKNIGERNSRYSL